MADNLERPDYTTYIKSEQPPDPKHIFKRSGGKCLCDCVRVRKTCLNYRPSDHDGNCRYLDRVMGLTCLWREGTHE